MQLNTTAATTLGSNVLTTVASTAGWQVGMAISGANIPANATVTAVGVNTLTISAAATGTVASTTITNYQLVSNAGWSAPTVPANTTVVKNVTTTAGSTVITIAACNAALLTAGTPISGPNIPVGATIVGGSVCAGPINISAAATVTGTAAHTFTLAPWANSYPPNAAGLAGVPLAQNCSVCPSLFTSPLCADEYVTYYMCPGNVYTITMCASAVSWNSTLTVTNTAGTFTAATGFATFDDDGCGTPSGHASLVYAPAAANIYSIRVFRNNGSGNSCLLDPLACGTVSITCSPAPPPPANDNPCGAMPIPAGTSCIYDGATTSWATATAGVPVPGCGSYSGLDVWFTSVVQPNGLAIQTNHVGAANIAMAVYTAPLCNSPIANWSLVQCNQDLLTGVVNEPYLLLPSALAGQTVYIRVWPQSGSANGGTFEICTYDPVPPPNDDPCNALPVPVTAGCTQVSSSNQNATATAGVPAPSCGTPGPYNDVWFTMTVPAVPAGSGVIINTASADLNDAALAVYTAGSCAGAFTEVGCNDPATGMPSLQVNQNGTTIVAGTTLYVRVWNKSAVFGNFTICATPTFPPANNEPCGAVALPLQYGCLYSSYTNLNATTTPVTLVGQHANVPSPSCGGTPTNDVWFTVQVPNPFTPPANLVINSDNFSLTDAAIAIYRVSSGNCGAGNLVLNQLSCQVVGPAADPMPQVTLAASTLTPGETLYVRVWRQTGADGTFQLCAQRTDAIPGLCNFILRMNDTGGDGWGGSFVTVCVNASCTNYSIIGSTGTIAFGAPNGAAVTLGYTAASGFENQISFQLTAPNGGILYSSASPPVAGPFVYAFTVNSTCNVPPAPQEDCVGAVVVCSNNSAQSANPQNTGSVADLNTSNRGCLITNERRGVWYAFQVSQPGQIGFTINPFPYGVSDYDFGLWGPYPSLTCPPNTLPLRCSWADGPSLTGLNWVATDVTEGVFGDSWNQYITASTGDWYLLFVDNWYMTGFAFDLTFQYQPGCGVGANPPCASIDCTLPVEFLGLSAERMGNAVALKWTTAKEANSSHFVIERSTDGKNFIAVGRSEAAGWSNTPIDYTWVDDAPGSGLNYYRLQQHDKDGAVTFTSIVAVNFLSARVPVHVYPNPAPDVLNITTDVAFEEGLLWRVHDASGRTVSEGKHGAIGSGAQWELQVAGLDAGSYMFEVLGTDGSALGNARFVKQ